MSEPLNLVRCPMCLEMIPEAAFICGKCQSVLVPQEWRTWCAEFRGMDPHSRYSRWISMTSAQRTEAARAWEALKMGAFPEFSAAPSLPQGAQEISPQAQGAMLVIFLAILAAIVIGALSR